MRIYWSQDKVKYLRRCRGDRLQSAAMWSYTNYPPKGLLIGTYNVWYLWHYYWRFLWKSAWALDRYWSYGIKRWYLYWRAFVTGGSLADQVPAVFQPPPYAFISLPIETLLTCEIHVSSSPRRNKWIGLESLEYLIFWKKATPLS